MYLGRVVGLGVLPDERKFAAYVVSGRSDSSRSRKARVYENGFMKRVNIGPLNPDSLTPEQQEQAQWIFYNAMIAPINNSKLLVSNGEQTDVAYMFTRDRTVGGENMHEINAIRCAMKALGPERDRPRTPRIAGFIDGTALQSWKGEYLAIITEDGYFFYPDQGQGFECEPGKMYFVSTYIGNPDNPRDIVIPRGKVKVPMGVIDLHGKRAEQLADNLYDWVDPDLIVCSAAALWNVDKGEFDIAVRNFHE